MIYYKRQKQNYLKNMRNGDSPSIDRKQNTYASEKIGMIHIKIKQ